MQKFIIRKLCCSQLAPDLPENRFNTPNFEHSTIGIYNVNSNSDFDLQVIDAYNKRKNLLITVGHQLQQIIIHPYQYFTMQHNFHL